MQINIQNLTTQNLSLDIPLSRWVGSKPRAIRSLLGPGATVDVGEIVALDDLNNTDEVQYLLAAGIIAITHAPESTDIIRDMPYAGRFSNATRPVNLASWQAAGYPAVPAAGDVQIFNTNDNAPNWWDGSAWRDSAGLLT